MMNGLLHSQPGIHHIAYGIQALSRALERDGELQIALQALQGRVMLANLGAHNGQLHAAHGRIERATSDIRLGGESTAAAWTILRYWRPVQRSLHSGIPRFSSVAVFPLWLFPLGAGLFVTAGAKIEPSYSD